MKKGFFSICFFVVFCFCGFCVFSEDRRLDIALVLIPRHRSSLQPRDTDFYELDRANADFDLICSFDTSSSCFILRNSTVNHILDYLLHGWILLHNLAFASLLSLRSFDNLFETRIGRLNTFRHLRHLLVVLLILFCIPCPLIALTLSEIR